MLTVFRLANPDVLWVDLDLLKAPTITRECRAARRRHFACRLFSIGHRLNVQTITRKYRVQASFRLPSVFPLGIGSRLKLSHVHAAGVHQ